jgi:Fe-S-cluster containining protein
MDKKNLYTEAYRMLDRSTPLVIDCGRLCGKACCQPGEEETGMYLFPGEETMYEEKPDWMEIKKANGFLENNTKTNLLICQGRCERSLRPLACRIFPLTPYLSSNDILQIKMDPRAEILCPLARRSSPNRLHHRFKKDVQAVFKMLIADEEIKEYIEGLSRMLDEYTRLPLWRL